MTYEELEAIYNNGIKQFLSGEASTIDPDVLQTYIAEQQEVVNDLRLDTLRIEGLEKALKSINSWADAYPLISVSEPDFAVCKKALEQAGQKLESVNASNVRHVIETVKRISDEALIGY
jgi:hypothetical protein